MVLEMARVFLLHKCMAENASNRGVDEVMAPFCLSVQSKSQTSSEWPLSLMDVDTVSDTNKIEAIPVSALATGGKAVCRVLLHKLPYK